MMWTQRRTPGRAGFGILITVAVLIASIAAPASGQAGTPVLGDGLWRVVFFLDQQAELGGVEVGYRGHGSAIIQMSDGAAAGEWNLSLSSVVLGTNATSNGVSIGTVSGDGMNQVLDFESMTVTDATYGITITMTADELPVSGGGTLTPMGRGCSAITGDWTIPFNDQTLSGEFIAQRLGAGGDETDANLRDSGLTIIEDARNGVINPLALREFIRMSEAGSEATERDDSCGLESARIFGNASTMLLNTVLVETGYAADDLDDESFMDFYRVVLRSGLNETFPDSYLTWDFGLRNRLAAAVASEDPADWTFWLPIARQIGEDEAADTLSRNICRERGDYYCEEIGE